MCRPIGHDEQKYKCRCAVCGKWFMAARNTAHYDTAACQMKAYRSRLSGVSIPCETREQNESNNE